MKIQSFIGLTAGSLVREINDNCPSEQASRLCADDCEAENIRCLKARFDRFHSGLNWVSFISLKESNV